MSHQKIEEWFRPLYGLPCWGLEHGRQTNLSIHFGNPSLHIREPFVAESQSPFVQNLSARRLVTVRGEWWLWLWCCHWRLSRNDDLLATASASRRRIEQALLQLSGQKLVGVSIEERTGCTRFEFDLGCRLECRRFTRDSQQDLWLLYRPGGDVLSVHGDGTYGHERDSRPE
jgi:hypothetical protein